MDDRDLLECDYKASMLQIIAERQRRIAMSKRNAHEDRPPYLGAPNQMIRDGATIVIAATTMRRVPPWRIV